MMRDAAITAGLVRSVGARDRWRDRLHIITYASFLFPLPSQIQIGASQRTRGGGSALRAPDRRSQAETQPDIHDL
jgi:hypothetical protein